MNGIEYLLSTVRALNNLLFVCSLCLFPSVAIAHSEHFKVQHPRGHHCRPELPWRKIYSMLRSPPCQAAATWPASMPPASLTTVTEVPQGPDGQCHYRGQRRGGKRKDFVMLGHHQQYIYRRRWYPASVPSCSAWGEEEEERQGRKIPDPYFSINLSVM